MADIGHEHGAEATKEWDGAGEPVVSVTVSGDEASGWTGSVTVENFVIVPAEAMTHVPGHGHLQLMLDGQLWNMVDTPVFTLPDLDPGSHVIMVTLYSNDHMDYVLAGEPIGAETTIKVAGTVEAADLTINVEYVNGQVTANPPHPRPSKATSSR